MTSALLLALLALTSGASKKNTSRLDAAQIAFNKGDFPAALKSCEGALQESSDPATLAKIYLLRGQIYGAQQDFPKAEEAFSDALDQDPEASLDPARVDPALVKVLDGLRARIKGDLTVRTDPPGADVALDNKPVGVSNVTVQASIGRHTLEVVSVTGKTTLKQEIVVHSGHNDVKFGIEEKEGAGGGKSGTGPSAAAAGPHPFGDLRAQTSTADVLGSIGLIIGGGIEMPYYRLGAYLQVVPYFGIAPSGSVVVPVVDQLNLLVSLQIPVEFHQAGVAIGFGGTGGVEYQPTKVLGVFVEVGAEHFFLQPMNFDDNRVIIDLGVRLRLP